MQTLFTVIGTIILAFIGTVLVVCVFFLPLIFLWRGYMIPKTWKQVEVTVTRWKQWNWRGKVWLEVEYTVEELVYKSTVYIGRASNHHLPPVGAKATCYYNPLNPKKTATKEGCASMVRRGLFSLIFNYSIVIVILLLMR